MLVLITVAVLQIALTKITGIFVFWIGYMSAFMAAGTLAYLMIDRKTEHASFVRVCLYVVAGLVTYKFAANVPAFLSREPSHFDFLAFYLDAMVASAGLNLYSPESYAEIAAQLNVEVTEHFRREIIDVGFKYPPPSVLLFLPLSYGSYEQAFGAWFPFVGATILATGFLLGYLILRQNEADLSRQSVLDALALSMIFVMSNSLDGSGFHYGQTTALLSCLIILTLLQMGKRVGGVAAAFGILIKPFAFVPAVFLVIGRYWSSVKAGIVTGVVIVVASLVVLGTDDWASYFQLDFSTETPAWLYNEAGNQSLLAVLLRGFGIDDIPWGYGYLVLIYGLLVFALGASSFWIAHRIAHRDSFTAYSLLLVTALLIYPGTLVTYSIILAIPLAIEFVNQLRSKRHYSITVLTFAVAGALWQWSFFAANVFVWTMLFRRALVEATIIDDFSELRENGT